MRLLAQLPNLLTLLNLLAGCIAINFALGAGQSNYQYALYFVALGIFFDFFDGFFARMFNTSSALGLQLDSLADMVTSGVVPGLVMFTLLDPKILENHGLPVWLQYSGFLITLGSCWRLANFNLDTRQTVNFIGLPTPANALMITSLPFIKFGDSFALFELLISPYVLFAITLFSMFILNANLPLFSLKIKELDFKSYGLQIFFVILSLVLLLTMGISGTPVIILSYILLSVLFKNRIAS